MGSRSRLMLLAAVLGGSVCLTVAVQAQGAADAADGASAPSVNLADPQPGRGEGEKNATPVPEVPTFPAGCPFRDNKLELIV